MEHFRPIDGIGDKEAFDLITPDVKASCAPIFMLHTVTSLIFVKRRTVKLIEPVSVLGKMRGNPVKNNTYSRLVHSIYERHKILGRAVARRRRIITADLIAPRAVKRVLHHGHKLDMGIPHLLDIVDKVGGKLSVGEIFVLIIPLPRTEVQLINIYRLRIRTIRRHFLTSVFKPALVTPFVGGRLHNQRSGVRRLFHSKSVRVCLQFFPALRKYAVFIDRHFLKQFIIENCLPYTAFGYPFHTLSDTPVTKVTRNVDRNCIGCPYPKRDLIAVNMSTHIFIGTIIRALMKEERCEVIHCSCQKPQLLSKN